MSNRLVVIGGVAAGMSAASKALRTNKSLDVTVYEKSNYVSYGACGLPYFIKGEIPDAMNLIVRTPAQFAKQGINVHIRHEVTRIDTVQKTVTVKNLETGDVFQDNWDKLMIAAGAVASRPPIPGLDQKGIFTLRSVEDGLAIRDWIDEQKPQRGVIVGGGYIGLEMAEALAAHGIAVTVVEMLPQLMPNIDADMAQFVSDELDRQQVKVLLSHKVESFAGDGQVTGVVANGETIPADVVIFSVGAKANVPLAEAAGIMIGPTGAIAVDDQQRTNIPNVWAAGDVAEAHHLVANAPAHIPLGTTANKQGKIAGTNIGGGQARFGGIVGTAVVKVFDLHVARTGLSEREANALGHDVTSVLIKSMARAHYMPVHPPIHVKLIYQKGTHRVLGAQMVGTEGVAKRIDVVVAALHAGWTTEQLGDLDLSYAPPFSPVWDPILVATNVANR